jgi:hypothetical protein
MNWFKLAQTQPANPQLQMQQWQQDVQNKMNDLQSKRQSLITLQQQIRNSQDYIANLQKQPTFSSDPNAQKKAADEQAKITQMQQQITYTNNIISQTQKQITDEHAYVSQLSSTNKTRPNVPYTPKQPSTFNPLDKRNYTNPFHAVGNWFNGKAHQWKQKGQA